MKPDKKPSRQRPTVASYLDALDHPQKPVVLAVRAAVLATSAEIHEGIKWNAPSFRTTEYFATFNLRSRAGADRVSLILHTGAKARASGEPWTVPDPEGLLEWLAQDRARITFGDLAEVKQKREALQRVLAAWIAALRGPTGPASRVAPPG